MACTNCEKEQQIINSNINYAREYGKANGYTEMVIYRSKNCIAFTFAEDKKLEGKEIIDRVLITD